jgi:mono/diheme cytochrome c family protein
VARRDVQIDDEKKSYSAVFLLSVGLLIAGAVWSVWDDNISRRPWKYYQVEFSEREETKAREELQEEDERLKADHAYQQMTQDLAAARQRLASGETARRIAALETQQARISTAHNDYDLELRIVKSRLEEAWYEYDHALLQHESTQPARARIEALDAEKAGIQKGFEETRGQLGQIAKELSEVRSELKGLEDKLKILTAERTRLNEKLEALTLKVGPFRLPTIPKIHQVVLQDFERNNFDQAVARVERCESCHAGVNKPGFDDAPEPYKTHPQRDLMLGKHPPEKFGCTPCHQGQGAAVNSPEQAHGEVHHWAEPLLRGALVQASCIKCHADAGHLTGADTIANGQKLFEELGCHGCHLVEGYEDLPKVGPYLRLIAAKADPSWLVRWVTNPHAYRAHTRMPNFLFKPDEAEAVAAYLLDSSKADSQQWLASRPAPTGVDPRDTALVTRGRELVDSLGCRGCHGVVAGESPALLGTDKDIAPNLSQVGEKTDVRWLYYWLKGPRDYSAVSRMPSLRLSDDEARAIASFLLTLGEKQETPGLQASLSDPDKITQGEKLVRKYGCAGCHDITGMEHEARIGVELTTFGSKPLEELFFGNHTDIPPTWDGWTLHKLADPRTYATERIEQVMPQFQLAPKDIEALRVFLKSRTDLKYPARFLAATDIRGQREVAGRRVVARYNCVGCHVIEGQGGVIRARYQDTPTLAPPVLNGEGAKVQPEWLYDFLLQPVPIRPWLAVRMPTFSLSDAEANTLVQYFGALANLTVPFVHFDESKVPPAYIEAAQQLASPDYFNCFSCHQQGDRKPEGPPEGWAPDLGMAHVRLNPDWIIRWLQDPQAVEPGTKMPSFFEQTVEGQISGGPDDVLDGNSQRQVEAIRDYLMVLQRASEVLKKNQENSTVVSAHEGVAAHVAN